MEAPTLSHCRDELTPALFLARSARVYPTRTAVIDEDRTFTYAEFAARADALGRALRDLGIEPGERVAVLAPNRCELLEAHFGVPASGAVLCALNTRLAGAEIAHILEHSGAKLVLCDPDLRHLVPDHLHVIELGDAYETMLAGASDAPLDPWPFHEEQPISVNYTSGTTGRPKGVLYSHRGAYLAALENVLETGLDANSRYLWTLPLFHCNGWTYPWAVTAAGATHVCLRKVDPARVWRELRSGITHLCGAPTVLVSLYSHPDAAPLERPLTITTAGAPPSPTVIARMEALGARIVHVYGLTETFGPFSVCAWPGEWDALPDEERHRLKARQGVPPIIGGGVRVLDTEGRDVPADGVTQGEIALRGNGVMLGYLDDPEATARACADGWFHSGDGAVMHPDGYVEIRDRAEGRDRLGRREHLERGGRAGHRAPPERARGGGDRHPRRPLGRAAEGVRHAGGRRDRGCGRADRVLPRPARALQVPGQHRVRRRCPRPRPARCRRWCCASASGRGARSG